MSGALDLDDVAATSSLAMRELVELREQRDAYKASLQAASMRVEELEAELARSRRKPDFLSQALNEGDGSYKP